MKSKSDNTQATLFWKEIRTANELTKPGEKKAGKQGAGELGSKGGRGSRGTGVGSWELVPAEPSAFKTQGAL